MNNRGLIIGIVILALIGIYMVFRGGGRDESVDDRVENYNQQMEDTMRSNSKRQAIEEELAEEAALLGNTE